MTMTLFRHLLTGLVLAGVLCSAPAQAQDTRRLLSSLQTLYADNVTGDISPQDLRDGILSTYQNCENPLTHGAVGDDVADDQPEIQAAIDAAGTGGTVCITQDIENGNKTYLLTAGGLEVSNDDVTILVERGVTIKMNNDADMLDITGDNVSVLGGIWDGNSAQTGSKRIFDIRGNFVRVEDTELKNGVGAAIYMQGASDGLLKNNIINASNGSCILIITSGSSHSRRNRIIGNHLTQTGGTSADAIQVPSGANPGFDVSYTEISGNYIEISGSQSFGIETGAFGGGTPVGMVITNNRIKSTGTTFGGISLSLVEDSVVSGNNIDLSGQTVSIGGIEVVRSNRVVIDGNYVKQGPDGERGIILGDPLGASFSANDNVISNNIVDGFANTNSNKAGIFVGTSSEGPVKRNLVTGNIVRFTETTNAGQVYFGIFVWSNHASGDVSDNVVSNNIILGNGDTAIRGIQVSGTVITQNTVRDNILIDLNQGIWRGSANVDLVLLDNTFQNVTSPYVGTASTSEIRRDIKQPKAQAFVANDLTPDISGGELFTTLNDTSTRIITMLDGGIDGDVVRIIVSDAFTEIDFTGTNLKGNAGVNWSPINGDHMTCVFDATDWYCDISDNTA